MQITYFKGCSSLSEVNSTLVNMFNSKYKELSKRDSVYDKILQEHMYLVCTTESIKELCEGNTSNPYSTTKNIHNSNIKWIDGVYHNLLKANKNPGATYFIYLKEVETLRIKPKKEDLERIAELCKYNPGWAYHKCKELNIK